VEKSFFLQPSSVSIVTSGDRRRLLDKASLPELAVIFSEVKSHYLSSNTNSSSYLSNMLRLKLVAPLGGIPSGNITFVLPNHFEQSYETNIQQGVLFNTTCEEGVIRSESFSCELGSGLPDHLLRHECVGFSEILSTRCPSLLHRPTCLTMGSNPSASCSVQSYTAFQTVCTCTLSTSGRARRLEFVEDESIQIMATTGYVAGDFGETMSHPLPLSSASDFGQVIVVFVLYGVLWTAGLSGIGCCFLSNSRNRKRLLEKKFQKRSQSSIATQEVQGKLVGYVDSVFPSVYQSTRWWGRLFSELSKHHRYMVLMMPTRDESMEKRRILTGVQLLTVQSMLMFLLAVACDLQVPLPLLISHSDPLSLVSDE
jgi:hypothetical protein